MIWRTQVYVRVYYLVSVWGVPENDESLGPADALVQLKAGVKGGDILGL